MRSALIAALMFAAATITLGDDAPPRAFIDGQEHGWKDLGESDFTPVNGAPDTWKWEGRLLRCTGEPIGVTRSNRPYTNFELSLEWKHLRSAGNSGVFAWASEESLRDLQPGQLPRGGIEFQVLDHGYAEQYEKKSGKKADFFTTNGAVGTSTMKPFEPLSPNGSRSFPRKKLSKGVNEWNHYYIRCINGEVRLWVNGEEVSGGRDCNPATGYLCLESDGSPVEFRHIRIRELP
jgi:hypothetical protein